MASSDWQKLDDLWYRKREIYEMKWIDDIDRLRYSVVAAAPFGGPIATVRNEKIFQPARGLLRPVLQVFTAGGTLIASSVWTFTGLLAMDWAPHEVLVCIFQDGVIRTFSSFCEKLHFFPLGDRIKAEGGILQALVTSTGVVVLSGKLRLYVNFSFEKQKLCRLADMNLRNPPLALCVLPPSSSSSSSVLPSSSSSSVTSSSSIAISSSLMSSSSSSSSSHKTSTSSSSATIHAIESSSSSSSSSSFSATTTTASSSSSFDSLDIRVLVASESGELLLVDRQNCTDMNVDDGPFIHLVVSRSGSLLACVSTSGVFKIFPTHNLSNALETSNIECRKKLRQIVWCGDDCIALYISLTTPSGDTQNMLFVGGPGNDWLPFQYDRSIFLISEVDGLRILTPFKSEFIQRIPPYTEAIFSIGSCEAPAMLCYALERFELGDVVADESLRAIQSELLEATYSCIDAAASEWHVEQISGLLRAAVFGRHFLESQGNSCARFIETCQNLRLCIAVRQAPVEIPITVAELKYLTLPRFVENLARRRFHFLASRICEYVGLSQSGVLIHWATEKIRNSLSLTDEQLCKLIVKKFQICPGISYLKVANVAATATRPNLATMLLEYEPRSEDQVRMLLKLGEISLATEKATASGDPDMIFECISTILAREQTTADGQRDMSILLQILKDKPLASDLFAAYCRRINEWEQLQQYEERRGRLLQAGWVSVSMAYQKTNWEQRKTLLAFAAGFFGSHKGQGEAFSRFAHTATLEQIELMNAQRDLTVKANSRGWPGGGGGGGGHQFHGLSLMETIRNVILKGEFQEADALQKHFKIPEKRYWHCKINSLADGGYFEEFLAFAQYRTSPVGYEPFLAACLRHNARDVATKIIPKLRDVDLQTKWSNKFGLRHETAETRGRAGGGETSRSNLLGRPTSGGGLGSGLLQTITGAFRRG